MSTKVFSVRLPSELVDRLDAVSKSRSGYIRDLLERELQGPQEVVSQRSTPEQNPELSSAGIHKDGEVDNPVLSYLSNAGATHRNRVMADLHLNDRQLAMHEHRLLSQNKIVSEGGILGLVA